MEYVRLCTMMNHYAQFCGLFMCYNHIYIYIYIYIYTHIHAHLLAHPYEDEEVTAIERARNDSG